MTNTTDTPAAEKPLGEHIVAAIDSLKSAMFHLKQSGLDDEGKLGRAQVEATLLNLERRLAEMRRLLPPATAKATAPKEQQ